MQSHRPVRALILVSIGVIALSLAGCGRKAGLDLPPSASAAPATHTETESFSPIAKPAKPKPRVVPDRQLPTDFLLD